MHTIENDEDNDAHVKGLCDCIEGSSSHHVHEGIDSLNFVKRVFRCIPQSENKNMKSAKKEFWRSIFICYPKENVSTKQSCQEGLTILSNFLKNDQLSKFSMKGMTQIDMHDGEDSVLAFDDYFLDEDIKKFLEKQFDRSDCSYVHREEVMSQ